MKDKDTLRSEYPAELIKSGERGKYVKSYREGTNIVIIAPDLRKLFPDSDSVNRALRKYAKEHRMTLT
ncbi:HicA protein [Candidatus Electrothrix aarhusensis]